MNILKLFEGCYSHMYDLTLLHKTKMQLIRGNKKEIHDLNQNEKYTSKHMVARKENRQGFNEVKLLLLMNTFSHLVMSFVVLVLILEINSNIILT